MNYFAMMLVCMFLGTSTLKATCQLLPMFSYKTKKQTVFFKNKSIGDYTAIEWNFGDGTTSKKTHPIHTYESGGMYAFSLSIYNEEGCSETYEGKVYIFKRETLTQDTSKQSIQVTAHKNGSPIIATNAAKQHVADLTTVSNFTNYPNSFVQQTNIAFLLNEAAHIQLSIYNLTGQLMQVITDEYMPLGQHLLHFRRTNLPNGVYLLLLQSENQQGDKQQSARTLVVR